MVAAARNHTVIARRRIAVDLTLAIVIASLLFGSWWLWGRHQPLPGTTTARVTGQQGRIPADPLAVADLGGVAKNYAGIDTLAGLRALDTLTDAELAVYRAAGTSRVRVAVSDYDTGTATVVVARTRGADAASRAARRLNELQRGYGFRETDTGLPGAALLPRTARGQPGGRAHYAHRDILVRVAMRGPDAPAVYRKFTELLRRQLGVLPDSG